ncbi:MAG: Vitamin B12 dependent methionine synthase activation subunit [Lachnospiraceae bacterium]|nr:Vitamin B12 dependent methionine synthase activation subunit [Lachnospiraceae bacterium]
MKVIGEIPFEIRRREIYRYLGYKNGALPDENVKALAEECVAEIRKEAVPRLVYRIDPVSFEEQGKVIFAGTKVHSEFLSRNLAGCSRVIIFAATLSSGIDVLLRKYSAIDVAKAMTLQAAAAETIESYIDAAVALIKERELTGGEKLKPRFSPGFGDWSIEDQRKVLALLNAGKTIGVTTAGESSMMLPSKTVTAVAGVYKSK